MAFDVPRDLTPGPDLAEVRRALAVLAPPGRTFEIRTLPTGACWIGRDLDAAAEAVTGLSSGFGVYYTLNPVRPDLTECTTNRDVIDRLRFLVDVDTDRPDTDVPATETEKGRAAEVTELIQQYLAGLGCPDPAVIDSGNGYQLVYGLDLPNNDLSTRMVTASLRNLARMFNRPGAHVDTGVYNASRIARLPGTWNRKGASTADRPHRIARLVVSPAALEPIPADVLKEISGADTPGAEPASHAPRLANWTVPGALNGEAEAWFRKGLENQLARAVLAPKGERHNVLRAAARTLAGQLHHGAFTEADLTRSLWIAGERAGLPEKEIRDLVAWGLENGKAEPMPWPDKLDKPKAVRAAEAVADPDAAAPFVWASSIVPRRVEFLWPGRIPLGKMTTFAGQGGLGKTFVLCDIAARVSTGEEWPFLGGLCAEKGRVLFISGEDDEDDTLVPRLIECGADLNQVAFLSAPVHDNFSLAALDVLSSVIDRMTGVRMVAIDPPTSYLDGVDDHRNSELRAVLTPLKRWAAENRVAVLMNTHVNKSTGPNVDAAARVMGSVAWVNAVRAAHMFVRDQDDPERVLFVPIKSNVARRPKGLSYRIVSTRDEMAKVEWLGEVDTTADEAMNRDAKKPRTMNARDWLIELFNKQREWPGDQFWASAKENAITKYALDQAKAALKIPRARRTVGADGDITYIFYVPPDWEHLSQ